MEEKRNERNNKSRTPKMKIDEKMQQEGSKNDEKIGIWGVEKSRKNREGGAFKRWKQGWCWIF